MARPTGRPFAARELTVHDLREQFLARCLAKNLSPRTIEWYEDRTRRFAEWCSARGVERAAILTGGDVDGFLIELRKDGLAPQTVRGFAQVVKTLCRFGHRQGFIAEDLTRDFEMPALWTRCFEDRSLPPRRFAPN